jgi:hypothetical protein
MLLEDGRVATWVIFLRYFTFGGSWILFGITYFSSIATVSEALRKVYNGVRRQIRYVTV